MSATVKLEGFEALDEKLHDLIRQKGEQILRKGLRAGGEIIQQLPSTCAPVAGRRARQGQPQESSMVTAHRRFEI